MVERVITILIDNIIEHHPHILLIGGDWFDRPTSFQSKAGVHISAAIATVVAVCSDYNVILLVVKGTGCHDGTQGENWISAASNYKKLTFRYYDTVDVFSAFGFNILTIPDSTIPNHHKCEVAIRTKLAELNLETVDIGFTHGEYTHHAWYDRNKIEVHSTEYYSSIVDIVILNGHMHTPHLEDKILDGGSTERLRQGESEPKGIHLVTINKEAKTFEALFIENKAAAIFDSYNVTEVDPTKAVEILSAKLVGLDRPDVYIRLCYMDEVPIRAIVKSLEKLYPNIIFDDMPDKKVAEALKRKRDLVLASTLPVGISPGTFIPLMQEKFKSINIKFTAKHLKELEELRDEFK